MKVAHRLWLVGAMFLTACSAASFSTNKNATLSKSAFGGEFTGQITQPNAPGNGIATGTINQPASGGAMGGIVQPGEEPATGRIHQPDGTDNEVDFLLMCSDRRSEEATNFKGALADGKSVQLLIDTKICSSDANVIKGLVAKKSFTVADANQICPGLVPADGTWSNVSIVVDGVPYNSIRGTITLLYALNREADPAEQAADELCDKRSSPLVIHIGSDPENPQPIALSSQERGILFDLLGARANHERVRISWFTNREYGMLALPDANGRVNSIDQLFGNSTVGPDGYFAENGYEALAKYDGTTEDGLFRSGAADGFIDSRDPVYERLKVWIDRNRDGVAQNRELVSLRDAGISFIDLTYSNDYAETDRYGNQTLMKSVVGRFDNSLDLIFDLWFAYQFGGR